MNSSKGRNKSNVQQIHYLPKYSPVKNVAPRTNEMSCKMFPEKQMIIKKHIWQFVKQKKK